MSASPPQTLRFGTFEANLATGELWKQGRKVSLQGMPFQLLSILLRRAGALVTREELRLALWPHDTHGEFDEGVNTAVRKVRQALGDDAGNPRFVETLARKGYRFIAPVSGTVTANREQPSVAVLPFDNSGAEDQQIISDGLTEDLISALAQVAGLRITARTSAFAFKGKHEDVRRIGEALGVAHVVEGSVRQDRNRIRVNAQLVRVADGTSLWSQRFDREMNDVFAMQDEISQAIADALKINFPGIDPASRRATPNQKAYHALLEGRHYLGRPSPENLQRGQESFTRAIELDPGFAAAHAGLAEALLYQAYQRLTSHSEAWRHAERAIALDPNCAEAYDVRAQVRGIFEYDWPASQADFLHATQLNPSSADVWDRYGVLYFRVLGRFEEALTAHQRACDLDPLAPFPRTNLAFTHHLLGQHEEAVERAAAALALFPDSPLVQHHVCMIYGAAGRNEEAQALARRGLESGDMLGWSSVSYLAKNPSDAAEWLRRLEEYSRRHAVVPGIFVLACVAAGDITHALEWAARAIEEHDAHFLVEFRAPCFAPLRTDARFARILQRAGLQVGRP